MYYNPYNQNQDERPIPTYGYAEGSPGCSAPQEPERPPKKKRRFWPKAVALCLVCAILGGAGGVAGSYFYFGNSGNGSGASATTIYESSREPAVVDVSYTGPEKEMSLEEVYTACVNSTVGITTEIVTNIFGQTVSTPASGSGFVISRDGYIVTNYHVIEGAHTIKVTFYDGTEYDATLVGGEESNDVAVLKIEAAGLTPVTIGDSDELNVGQTVTAIGNPLGELTFTQTAGIVSATDRSITLSDGATLNMIQTDCAINSGNSGGPLFNTYGEVIGITTAKYSASASETTIEGLGFAIPMNDVLDIIKDLIEHGYVTGKPSVGILGDDVDSAAQRYGIPAGAVITAVLEGSCADKGGLQADDIITAVDGAAVGSFAEMQSAVQRHRAGDTITFTVYRDGNTLDVRLTLDENNQERSDALDALNEELSQSQQQNQPQNQQPSSQYPYDFGFGWPFGW